MAVWYLAVAVFLTAMLNASPRWLRAVGTFIAALGLMMIVLSIMLANLDGTFAAVPADAPLYRLWTPAILNIQAAIASGAAVFLCWAAWMQALRPLSERVSLANSATTFGSVSRALHWVIAILMFCLIPIGLFMTALATEHPERGGFVAAHQSLGLTIFAAVMVRILWLRASPPPAAEKTTAAWRHGVARIVHLVLYFVLIVFPLSGYVLSAAGPDPLAFYGFLLPVVIQPDETVASVSRLVHNWVLPLVFYAAITLHVVAVGYTHFADGRKIAVRRMLR